MNELASIELELLRRLEDLEGVDSLLDFVPLVSPWYKRPDHLRPLAKLFWEAETVGGVRALTSTPPQHGKSESILHWLARYILRNPDKVCAYVTYAAQLAQSKSKVCRDIAERAGLRLASDSQAAHEWRTEQGGGLIATGVGGPLTGHRVDLLVIDDPVKNRRDAESGVFQSATLSWAKSTAFTRLTPLGSVIVNMARWTDGDLVGRLQQETGSRWQVVNLPAVTKEGDQESALWEEGRPLAFIKEQRRLLGEYEFEALFMGQPRPRGGALFGTPNTYSLPSLSGARYAIACDPAASASNAADHSAIVVLAAIGDGIDQTVYVLEVWRAQVEVPALVEKLRQMQIRWRAPIFVEAQGGFKAVPQMLRAIGAGSKGQGLDPLRVVEVHATTDKYTRALPVSAAWNDGRVLVPEDNPSWKEPFLREVMRFTGRGDVQDDQTDALAHAFRAIDRRAIAIERGAFRVPGSLV